MQIESKDHNKLVEDCQNRYLENRNHKTLSEMYLILTDYYNNLFINYTHRKGLYWTDDEIREKSFDASTRIIERFIKNPDFKIDSLTAYGHWDMVWVLYHDKDYELKRRSFDSLIDSLQGKENERKN